MAGAKWTAMPNSESYIWFMIFAEIGVHSTIDIAQELSLTFDGTYENDPYNIV